MRLALLLVLAHAGSRHSADAKLIGGKRSFAWYRTDVPWEQCMPPAQIPWDSITHLASAAPTILPNITAVCNNTAAEHALFDMARAHDVKNIWVISDDIFPRTKTHRTAQS
jgi:hypothetical protein